MPGTRVQSPRGSAEPATGRPPAAALRRAAEGSARRASGPRCPGRRRREHPPPPPAPPLAHCARRRRHRRPPRAAGAGCPRSQLARARSLRATANSRRRRGRRLRVRQPKARRLLTNSPPKAAAAATAAGVSRTRAVPAPPARPASVPARTAREPWRLPPPQVAGHLETKQESRSFCRPQTPVLAAGRRPPARPAVQETPKAVPSLSCRTHLPPQILPFFSPCAADTLRI